MSVELEYMEPQSKNGKRYVSIMEVNSTVPMMVLENYNKYDLQCVNTTFAALGLNQTVDEGRQLTELMRLDMQDITSYLNMEAILEDVQLKSLIVITNREASGCSSKEARGFHNVISYNKDIGCEYCFFLQTTRVTIKDFASTIGLTYGTIDESEIPSVMKRRRKLNRKRATTDAVPATANNGDATTLISSSSHIDGTAVVDQTEPRGELPANGTLVTIPPHLCDTQCENDIINGLNNVGLLQPSQWSNVIAEGLEQAALNPPKVGEDDDIDFIFNDPSATYTNLEPSQVIAVPANAQITARAVLPRDAGPRYLHNKRRVNPMWSHHLQKRCAWYDAVCLAEEGYKSASSLANSLFNDAKHGYEDATNFGKSQLSSLSTAFVRLEADVTNSINSIATQVTNDVKSIEAKATSAVLSIASEASNEATAVVNSASSVYAEATNKASSIVAQASVYGDEALSLAASASKVAASSASQFLSQAEAKATQLGQVVIDYGQQVAGDVVSEAINVGQDLKNAGEDFVNDLDEATKVVGDGIVNAANQVAATYEEVSSEIQKALGEHEFDFDQPLNFDIQPGKGKITPFGREGFQLPGFPISIAKKATSVGVFEGSIDAYCLDCGLRGSADLSGKLIIDILNPSKTDFVADIDLNAMLALELGLELVGSFSHNSTFPLGTVALPGLSIPGIVSFGPDIKLELGLGVYTEGALQFSTGVKMQFTNSKLHLDLLSPGNTAAYNLRPQVQVIYPKFQGEFKIVINPFIRTSIELGINVAGDLFEATAGIAFQTGFGVEAQGYIEIADLSPKGKRETTDQYNQEKADAEAAARADAANYAAKNAAASASLAAAQKNAAAATQRANDLAANSILSAQSSASSLEAAASASAAAIAASANNAVATIKAVIPGDIAAVQMINNLQARITQLMGQLDALSATIKSDQAQILQLQRSGNFLDKLKIPTLQAKIVQEQASYNALYYNAIPSARTNLQNYISAAQSSAVAIYKATAAQSAGGPLQTKQSDAQTKAQQLEDAALLAALKAGGGYVGDKAGAAVKSALGFAPAKTQGAVSTPTVVISKGQNYVCPNGVVVSTFLTLDIYVYYGIELTNVGGQYQLYNHIFPIAAKCFQFGSSNPVDTSSSSVPVIGPSGVQTTPVVISSPTAPVDKVSTTFTSSTRKSTDDSITSPTTTYQKGAVPPTDTPDVSTGANTTVTYSTSSESGRLPTEVPVNFSIPISTYTQEPSPTGNGSSIPDVSLTSTRFPTDLPVDQSTDGPYGSNTDSDTGNGTSTRSSSTSYYKGLITPTATDGFETSTGTDQSTQTSSTSYYKGLITPTGTDDLGTSSTNTATGANPTGSSPVSQYIGCYRDDINYRSLAGPDLRADDMTVEKCGAFCALSGSYSLFGVEYSRECYCGNGLRNGLTDPKNCDMQCSGNEKEICGGGLALSVYTIHQSVADAVTQQQQDTLAAPVFAELGCKQDLWPQGRVLNGANYKDFSGLTKENCATFCSLRGYAFGGVEYSSECYCGTSAPIANTYGCDYPCSGDKSQTCGGSNAIEVFALKYAKDVVNPTLLPYIPSFPSATMVSSSTSPTQSATVTSTSSSDTPSGMFGTATSRSHSWQPYYPSGEPTSSTGSTSSTTPAPVFSTEFPESTSATHEPSQKYSSNTSIESQPTTAPTSVSDTSSDSTNETIAPTGIPINHHTPVSPDSSSATSTILASIPSTSDVHQTASTTSPSFTSRATGQSTTVATSTPSSSDIYSTPTKSTPSSATESTSPPSSIYESTSTSSSSKSIPAHSSNSSPSSSTVSSTHSSSSVSSSSSSVPAFTSSSSTSSSTSSSAHTSSSVFSSSSSVPASTSTSATLSSSISSSSKSKTKNRTRKVKTIYVTTTVQEPWKQSTSATLTQTYSSDYDGDVTVSVMLPASTTTTSTASSLNTSSGSKATSTGWN